MNVSLTPELEKFIEEKVESGMYGSQSEVVRDGLRLVMERDRMIAARIDQIRGKVAKGLDQARRGELIPGDEVFDDLLPNDRDPGERRK